MTNLKLNSKICGSFDAARDIVSPIVHHQESGMVLFQMSNICFPYICRIWDGISEFVGLIDHSLSGLCKYFVTEEVDINYR